MKRPLLCLLVVVTLLGSATTAQADVFLSPGGGMSFGGLILDGGKVTYTGQLTVLGDSMIGFEADYGYVMKIRGGGGGDNLRTISAALLIAPAALGSDRFRPYASVGFGVVGAVGKVAHLVSFGGDEAESASVASAGGGLMLLSSGRFGVRLDARYFRALLADDQHVRSPHFIRASGAIVFRF